MKKNIEVRALRHAAALDLLFPEATKSGLALCRSLRRIEAKVSRLAVDYCNGVIDGDKWETETDKARASLAALLGESPAPVYLNGDPRGYALKIEDGFTREWNKSAAVPIDSDWGGYGLLAPDLSAA